MKENRWPQVKIILAKALELTVSEQANYVEAACCGDEELKAEVLALLTYQSKADSFLSNSLSGEIATKFHNNLIPIAGQAALVLEIERVQAMLLDLVGEVLDGKYKLEQQLDQGGMGAIYKATHLGTERPVALKIIMPQFMSKPEFVERFRIEAKAAGKLQHPNIVNVTDFGFAQVGTDQLAYLVMEFLDGLSLGALLKRKPKLSLELVIDIVEQICLAIEAAHNQGIVHRDLKPDNIWLEPNGQSRYNVKILDFGLAKFKDSESENSLFLSPLSNSPILSLLPTLQGRSPALATVSSSQNSSIDTAQQIAVLPVAHTLPAQLSVTEGDLHPNTVPECLTRIGAIMGTPLYMSPEQCNGGEITPKSDIYSLGVVIYQMLAGETPFQGNLYQIMHNHRELPAVSLREKRRDLPKPITNLVMSTLAKNPAERPASARILANSLRAKFEGEALVMRQAQNLYQENRATFLSLFFILHSPFILFLWLAMLLITDSRLLVTTSFPVVAKIVVWLGLLATIFLGNSLNIAATALVLKQLTLNSSARIKIRTIIWELLKRLPQLVITLTESGLLTIWHSFKLVVPGLKTYCEHLLTIPVVILEDVVGTKALLRSQTLVRSLPEQILTTQVRNIVNASITLVLVQSAWLICSLMVGLLSDEVVMRIENPTFYTKALAGLFMVGVIVLPFLLPITYTIFSHPKTAIGFVLHYFTALKISPTGSPEGLNQLLEGKSELKRGRLPYQQALVLASGLVAILVIGSLLKQILFLSNITVHNRLLAQSLIALGTDVNTKSIVGQSTLLMLAAKEGDIRMVSLLLDKGAKVNERDIFGRTALLLAIQNGHIELVNELLRKGATLDLESDKTHRAQCLQAALGSRKNELIKELLAKSPDLSTDSTMVLCLASAFGYTDTVQMLLASANTDVNGKSYQGRTALHNAINNNHVDIVKLLLAAGASTTSRDTEGNTPFQLAITRKNSEIIQLLKETGR